MNTPPRGHQESSENFDLSEQTLLQTKLFQVQRVRQSFQDGRVHERDIIRHPGAVVVLPILDDGRVCLIRNYRVAVGKWLLELPAGTLEPGEAPQQTAERELTEETGYRARSVRPLCEFFMSPGILHERMHAFVASGLSAGNAAREPGEMIVNHLMTPAEIDEHLRSQQIEDAKTIATLLYYLRFGNHATASAKQAR